MADQTMKQKFEEGLRELINLCLDGNMHPSEMIEALEAELKWARQPYQNPADNLPPPRTRSDGANQTFRKD